MSGFSIDVRVYYEDTDHGGIVYYANYLKYMERARTEALRSHGFLQQELHEKKRRMFVVRKAEIEYFQPAVLDDQLTVSAFVAEMKRASLVFGHKIHNQHGQLITGGSVLLACLNADTYRPVAIPEQLVEVLKIEC